MGFLVGNDFIPHLPHLHINHDALPLLYKTYIEVLPTLGGECLKQNTLSVIFFLVHLVVTDCFIDLEKIIIFETLFLSGYINEGGTLNLEHFEKYLLKLSEVSSDCFHHLNALFEF